LEEHPKRSNHGVKLVVLKTRLRHIRTLQCPFKFMPLGWRIAFLALKDFNDILLHTPIPKLIPLLHTSPPSSAYDKLEVHWRWCTRRVLIETLRHKSWLSRSHWTQPKVPQLPQYMLLQFHPLIHACSSSSSAIFVVPSALSISALWLLKPAKSPRSYVAFSVPATTKVTQNFPACARIPVTRGPQL